MNPKFSPSSTRSRHDWEHPPRLVRLVPTLSNNQLGRSPHFRSTRRRNRAAQKCVRRLPSSDAFRWNGDADRTIAGATKILERRQMGPVMARTEMAGGASSERTHQLRRRTSRWCCPVPTFFPEWNSLFSSSLKLWNTCIAIRLWRRTLRRWRDSLMLHPLNQMGS